MVQGQNCNGELWDLRKCKILQTKFLFQFSDNIILPWHRDTIVMSNYGIFEILKYTIQVPCIISSHFSLTIVQGHNCNIELWDFQIFNF